MKRRLIHLGALLCALIVPLLTPALPPAAAATAPSSVTGTVTYVSWSLLTLQTPGRRMGLINAMSATANAITRADYPYVWAGGHAAAGMASPGSRGHVVGFDCSGSVAAVLAGAGLWPAGSPVPSDAGVIDQLLAERLIARGPGAAPDSVNLYDDRGAHIFMSIDGRFFGTSDGVGGGSRRGGAGWLDDGAPDAYSRAYRVYHVLPSVLRDRTSYGHSYTFQLGSAQSLLDGVQAGDRVTVGYLPAMGGVLALQTLTFPGAVAVDGAVTSYDPGSASLVLQTLGGQLTISTTRMENSAGALQPGDGLQVVYTRSAGSLLARSITLTAQPTAPTDGSTFPPDGPSGSSGSAGGGAAAGSSWAGPAPS